VSIHLSWEVSRLEEETRTLAEDAALLRTEMREQLDALRRERREPVEARHE